MLLDWASIDILEWKKERKPMLFTERWGEGPVFEWYQELERQGPKSVLVTRLRVLNDGGKVPHRFVVASLQSGEVYRFDRRPLTKKPVTLIAEALGPLSTRKAADQYELIEEEKVEDVIKSSICEIDLKMPENTSLLHIISACFSLSNDIKTVHYELFKYNCYFFSWTVVMIVARHTHELPLPSTVVLAKRFDSKLDYLVGYIMDRILRALLQFVTETVSSFRAETKRKLDIGMGKRELMVWRLPIGAVNWALGLFLRFRFQLGLEKTFKNKVKEMVKSHVGPMLVQIFESQSNATRDQVKQRLWINDLSEEFRTIVERTVLKVLWSAILDTLAEGYNGINGEQLIAHFKNHPKFRYRLKYRLSGKNVIQFTQIWNDALNAALLAARDRFRVLENIPNDPKEMHEMVFNEVFDAGCLAARNAAEAVVNKTRGDINNPMRDQMWEEVWKVWDTVWSSSREKCREVAVNVIEEGIKEITRVAALVIMEEYNSHAQDKEAPKKTTYVENQVTPLDKIQASINYYINSAPILMKRNSSSTDVTGIQAAMTRAWNHSLDTFVDKT
ncbi:hypothetical protein RHS03_00080, partial [Rhizoctonia solani]